MDGSVFVSAWSAWAPGIQSPEEWRAWAQGERTLQSASDNPPLAHVDPLFKRRLSQLTRMTIQVGHEALAGQPPMKIAFASTYGEIGQQCKITDRLIAEGEVSPANFSLSVFNTPVAALSIAEKNTEGYVAVYPGKDAFRLGFIESASAILSGAERARLFITADELLPAPYAELEGGSPPPYALALVLSAGPSGIRVPTDPALLSWWGEGASCRGDSSLSPVPDALRFLSRVILSAGAIPSTGAV